MKFKKRDSELKGSLNNRIIIRQQFVSSTLIGYQQVHEPWWLPLNNSIICVLALRHDTYLWSPSKDSFSSFWKNYLSPTASSSSTWRTLLNLFGDWIVYKMFCPTFPQGHCNTRQFYFFTHFYSNSFPFSFCNLLCPTFLSFDCVTGWWNFFFIIVLIFFFSESMQSIFTEARTQESFYIKISKAHE